MLVQTSVHAACPYNSWESIMKNLCKNTKKFQQDKSSTFHKLFFKVSSLLPKNKYRLPKMEADLLWTKSATLLRYKMSECLPFILWL